MADVETSFAAAAAGAAPNERLERLVVRARATLWWERAWPASGQNNSI